MSLVKKMGTRSTRCIVLLALVAPVAHAGVGAVHEERHHPRLGHVDVAVDSGWRGGRRGESNARGKRRALLRRQVWASTAQLAYRAPQRECYGAPTWTERYNSNIGQPDSVLRHGRTA